MSKPRIENITVEADSYRPAVLWTIGARRFHVWIDPDGVPEDVVHSNPITPTARPARDEHRALDRTNKTQAAVWAEVWAVVVRDDLLAKAQRAEADRLAQVRRRTALRQEMHEIEQDVLNDWRAGTITINAPRFERYDAARRELASLGGDKQ
jgi:hypothetical protein